MTTTKTPAALRPPFPRELDELLDAAARFGARVTWRDAGAGDQIAVEVAHPSLNCGKLVQYGYTLRQACEQLLERVEVAAAEHEKRERESLKARIDAIEREAA